MPATVLIVEDDEPTQMLLEALMQRGGIESVIARDGGKAIELLETRDDFACLILDLMMPSVNGMSVIEYLSGKERKVPVIVCTAVISATTPPLDPSVVRAVVRKPFDIEHLAATTAALIAGREDLPES